MALKVSAITPCHRAAIKPILKYPLFELVKARDLEGLVVKRKDSKYRPETRWYKVLNPGHSQKVGCLYSSIPVQRLQAPVSAQLANVAIPTHRFLRDTCNDRSWLNTPTCNLIKSSLAPITGGTRGKDQSEIVDPGANTEAVFQEQQPDSQSESPKTENDSFHSSILSH